VLEVYVEGELVVQDGQHRLQDEIVREFGKVQRNLWR
jgi:hypothetical protein